MNNNLGSENWVRVQPNLGFELETECACGSLMARGIRTGKRNGRQLYSMICDDCEELQGDGSDMWYMEPVDDGHTRKVLT